MTNDLFSIAASGWIGTTWVMKLHLVKSYCLPSLFCGCEVWSLTTPDVNKINVVWNKGFRRIFGGFWREIVKLLGLQFCYYFFVIMSSMQVFRRAVRTRARTVQHAQHLQREIHSASKSNYLYLLYFVHASVLVLNSLSWIETVFFNIFYLICNDFTFSRWLRACDFSVAILTTSRVAKFYT